MPRSHSASPPIFASTPAAACLALLLAGCSSDKNVGILHQPPAVTISSPSEGASFFEGESIRFEALAQTSDGSSPTELTASWVTGTSTMCSSGTVDSEGVATCDWTFDEAGEQTVTVTVTDSQLDSASATVTVQIEVNTPPSIELLAPSTGDFFEPAEIVVFEAQVSDAEDSPEDLTVSVTSSIDGDLALDAPPSSSGSWTAATSLSNGDHLITVRVTDRAGRTDQDTATISVNARPAAPVVQISPDPAPSGDALTAVLVSPAVDPEGDGVTYRYDWYKDGSLYQSSTSDTLARGITVRGDYWEVYAYPNDGFGYGDAGVDAISIENSAPAIDAVTISPSLPTTVDALVAVPTGWDDQDSDPERYRYAWYLNETLDSGETTSTFPAAKTEKGDLVRVTVTPLDDYDVGEAVDSATVEIQNSPPTEPTVAITPTSPEPTDNLYCSVTVASTDADRDTISYTYAWYKDGSLTSITSNVVNSSYLTHGESWECVVTPTDGEDDGPDASAYVTINDGTAPDAPVLNSITPYRNDETVAITGTCEAGCTLDFYCSDSSTTWTDTATCSSTGSLSWTTSVDRGEVGECYATCTDSAGNTSANSNTVETEVCDPTDEFEDSTGYGDSGSDAIGEWASLADDGSDTITIEGNILSDDSVDWYVIGASDDVSDDYAAGLDYFNFEVNLVEGASTYEFKVYRDSPDATDLECSTAANEYSWFNQDVGDGSHAIPSDSRTCGSGSATANNCADDSADFYIQVTRKSSVSMSCQHYELEITNGVW